MSVIRHEHKPKAPTRSQVLAAGGIIDAHSHDEHQIIYAGAGVLAITTTAGTWFTPGTSAIWVPAGTVHAHRAQGHLELHMLGVPAGLNPLGTDEPDPGRCQSPAAGTHHRLHPQPAGHQRGTGTAVPCPP